ncbi:MAG: hydroxymethylglutaryl-CoA lyase [Alphaproteobacteria bacterium]
MASDTVQIVEVGPRDGLQNEATPVSVADRMAFITALADAGVKRIEAGAFVSPKWVPQMAGTDEVLGGLTGLPADVELSVLVPNMRGMDAAQACTGITEIAVFAAASEAFSQKNINCSIDESLQRFAPVAEAAKAAGYRLRGYVSCVLGCPYQGDVPLSDVVRVSKALQDAGCAEISLGDTIGIGTPYKARKMVEAVASEVPVSQLAVHYHDTYGQALANTLACLEAGIRVVDSAAGGLGGCPYAKGASGNLATEDLIYMLDGLGMQTGIDLDRLIAAAWQISSAVGRPPQSRLAHARKPA